MQQIFSILPVLVFFLVYKFSPNFTNQYQPIILATLSLVVCTILTMLYQYVRKIKQDKLNLYSNIAIIVFGSMTVLFNNPSFIKVKITLINLFFGGALLWGYFSSTPFLKKLLDGKIAMEDKMWRVLSLRFSLMFFAIAIGNEIAYRFFTEAQWVNFKVFYVPTFTIVFMLLHVRFFLKNAKNLPNS